MKNKIIFALLGGVVGFGIGYFVSNKKNEEEIASLKEEIDYLYDANDALKNKIIECEEQEVIEEEPIEEPVQEVEQIKEIVEKNNYTSKEEILNEFRNKKAKDEKVRQERKDNKYSKKHIDYDPEDEYYDDEVDDNGNPYPTPSEPQSCPYSIEYEDFANNCLDYEKRSIKYYEKDDLLIYIDSDEEILNDGYLFGNDWRDHVGEYVRDMVFIRNPELMTDFEISFEKGDYIRE